MLHYNFIIIQQQKSIRKFIMQPQVEIQVLQSKIQSHETQLHQLENQQEKLSSHIAQFRQAIKKKSVVNVTQANMTSGDNLGKSFKQLEKQLESAQNSYKNYIYQLKNLEKREANIKGQDLGEIQAQFREKEIRLKNLKETIKQLQAIKRKKEKIHNKKIKNEDGGKLTKMIDEIRKNQDLLDSYSLKRKQKQQNFDKKKIQLEDLEKKYRLKCQQNGQNPLTYEQFKKKKRDKRREQASESKNKYIPSKKQQHSVKEIIHAQLFYDKLEPSQKTVKQLKNKKQIAESSLKNANKKWEKDIQQIQIKVQGLQKENQKLNTRLLQKKKERQMADSNVIEYAKNYASSTRTTRKLTPIK